MRGNIIAIASAQNKKKKDKYNQEVAIRNDLEKQHKQSPSQTIQQQIQTEINDILMKSLARRLRKQPNDSISSIRNPKTDTLTEDQEEVLIIFYKDLYSSKCRQQLSSLDLP